MGPIACIAEMRTPAITGSVKRRITCRFFDQPETRHKLDLLGPGDVFVDTDLAAMANRQSQEAEKDGRAGGGEANP